MKFYRRHFRAVIREGAEFPCFSLARDNWDDYGWKTLYQLFYHARREETEEIGFVKILDINPEIDATDVESVFETLPENLCSLGQSLDYYGNLKFFFPDTYIEILASLNDVAFFPEIQHRFSENPGFAKSLLRNSEAEKALIEARQTLESGEMSIQSNFRFVYTTLLAGANDPHVVDVDFSNPIDSFFRSFVLIGRNGTGKTQFLNNLAFSLCNLENTKSFEPARPLFSKVIAISFSLFDEFKTPPSSRQFSYKFIGFRQDKGLLSDAKIDERLKESFEEIKKQERQEQWLKFVRRVIQIEFVGDEIERLLTDDSNIDQIIDQRKAVLSSGQSILIFIITELLATLRKDSIILFDEPETHLHPNSIARLVRVINEILMEYNSYSVVATHSPIVLQETPSQNVRIFDRIGQTPLIKKLSEESLGENLAKITDSTFFRNEIKEVYKEYFDEQLKTRSPKEINELFDNKLSLNALLYLASVFEEKDL